MPLENPTVKVQVAGSPKVGAVLDVRTVVMPASYAANGAPVDLSAVFSELYAVQVLRAYTTSTKLGDGRLYVPVETGTDTYADRKFRVQAFNPRAAFTPAGSVSSVSAGTPAGTVSAPTFSGSALGTHNHAVTHGSVACAGGHSALTCNYDKADPTVSSVSAGTPAGTNSAPTFTGSALGTHGHTFTGTAVAAAAGAEVAAGTNLSTITVEYLAIGKP